MATYKVPQDVEAEDKLIGPLSLKQFIFAILFFASGYVTYLFTQIPPQPLFGIVGLPFLIIFGVLAFYQRKDQPVEVYLLAWLNYHLKPKKRVWDQEGYEEHVIITVPKVEEIDYTKGLNQKTIEEKTKQFSQLVDTRGWSARGVTETDSGLAGQQRILSQDELDQLRGANLTNQDPKDPYDQGLVAGNVDNLVNQHALAQQNNIKLSVDQARQVVADNEKVSTITGKPVMNNPQINELANNDLLPISEIAKKAESLDKDSEVEVNLH